MSGTVSSGGFIESGIVPSMRIPGVWDCAWCVVTVPNGEYLVSGTVPSMRCLLSWTVPCGECLLSGTVPSGEIRFR